MRTMMTVVSALAALSMLLPTAAQGQEWAVRFGGVGVGTRDLGSVFFRPATGLGTQTFDLSNSWGPAVGVETRMSDRVRMSLTVAHAVADLAFVIDDGGGSFRDADRTSYTPVIGGVLFDVVSGRRVTPRVGLMLGYLVTGDVRLRTGAAEPDVDYRLEDRWMGGYGVGVDVRLGSGPWHVSFDIKSLGVRYALEGNAMVEAQGLLDQDFANAFNHLELTLARGWR